MKTLVIFDATDPVQVAGAAILKQGYGSDCVLSATATGKADRVHNLKDIDITTLSESQYAIASDVLDCDFSSLTLETSPTVFSASTIGKSGLTWGVDEHAGKWAYIKGAATNDLVLIASNTATTLSFAHNVVNTPDGTCSFAIVPEIELYWFGGNAVYSASQFLPGSTTTYPIGLLGEGGRVYNGICDAVGSTATVAGFAANSLADHYVAVQDLTEGYWFTRKIVSNTDAAVTVDRAWDVAVTGSSPIFIYSSLAHLLKDIHFSIYADAYMRDPNHPYWSQLIDDEGRIADGVATYNKALFDNILADGKIMFDALQVGNGGPLSYLDY